MQIGSVVWEEFDHIHTHIHTHGIGLSIRVTLNTKPASQVLIKYTRRGCSFFNHFVLSADLFCYVPTWSLIMSRLVRIARGRAFICSFPQVLPATRKHDMVERRSIEQSKLLDTSLFTLPCY